MFSPSACLTSRRSREAQGGAVIAAHQHIIMQPFRCKSTRSGDKAFILHVDEAKTNTSGSNCTRSLTSVCSAFVPVEPVSAVLPPAGETRAAQSLKRFLFQKNTQSIHVLLETRQVFYGTKMVEILKDLGTSTDIWEHFKAF